TRFPILSVDAPDLPPGPKCGKCHGMKYRVLGKTGLSVSMVGFGTWQFGGEWGKTFAFEEVETLLMHAKDKGINLIDTAECYGDGVSESLIGRALRGQRHEWVIATKC